MMKAASTELLKEEAQHLEETAFEMLNRMRERGWLATKEEKKNADDFTVCLPVLLTALRWHGNTHDICDALPYFKKHLDRVDFLNTFAHLGYKAHSVKINLEEIDERLHPCLFIPDADPNNPQVVLRSDPEKKNIISVFDCRDEKIIPHSRNIQVPGEAWFFQQVEEEDDKEERNATGFTWFRHMIGRFKGVFAQIFIMSFMLNIVALFTPLFVMVVYDRVIGAHSPYTLYYLVIGVVLALGVEWALRLYRLRVLSWFGTRINMIVSNAIFQHLLYLPPIFTERAPVAAQIARLKTFESVRDFFIGPIFLSLLELPFALILLATIAFISPQLALIPVVMAGVYLLMLAVFSPVLRARIHTSAKASSEKQQLSVETFSKLPAIRYNGMTEAWMTRFHDISGKASLLSFRSALVASIVESLAHGLSIVAGVATIAFGVELIWSGDLSMGALIAVMILIWRVLSPLHTACSMLPRIEQVRNSIDQVNRLMDITPEREPFASATTFKHIKGHVTFTNVGLRYTKNTDPVFAGLSFEAKPGELVAISGGNGSGKSTVLKLACGLYEPQAGMVRIDGADIRQLDSIELRRHIAYVPQTPEFFTGTLRVNLRISEPLASDEMIIEALKQADAWEEVRALPKGLDTRIGAGKHSSSITSGLGYRLGLARAYLKDAQILLFDELPNSLLNSRNGIAYRKFLEGCRGKQTVLMVTHRSDYLRMADTVVLLRPESRPIVGKPDDILRKMNL